MDDNTHSLNFDQVQKLYGVLTNPVEICPPDNFPVLKIAPASIVKVVRNRLIKKDIKLRDIRLNGSAASYCLCEDSKSLPQVHFNDIDLIFGVSIERESDFHVIKEEVLTSLLEFFPEEVTKENIGTQLLEETYIRKMVLVSNATQKWSLFSLGDHSNSISIELKFVCEMKRKFEFTVDSFQILLDSYFNFGECTEDSPSVSVSPTFFPSVQALSVYHDYSEALDHLNKRLIHTEAPEEIRGGGLLKYCSLMVSGYKPANPDTMKHLEPYMCIRFFIDFPTVEAQYAKINKYITTRFMQRGNVMKCKNYLERLYQVVSGHARCLMERQCLYMISQLHSMVWYPFIHIYPLPPPYIPIAGFPGNDASGYPITTTGPIHMITSSLHHDDHHRQYHQYSSSSSSEASSNSPRSSPPPPSQPTPCHHYHQSPSPRQRRIHRNNNSNSNSKASHFVKPLVEGSRAWYCYHHHDEPLISPAVPQSTQVQ